MAFVDLHGTGYHVNVFVHNLWFSILICIVVRRAKFYAFTPPKLSNIVGDALLSIHSDPLITNRHPTQTMSQLRTTIVVFTCNKPHLHHTLLVWIIGRGLHTINRQMFQLLRFLLHTHPQQMPLISGKNVGKHITVTRHATFHKFLFTNIRYICAWQRAWWYVMTPQFNISFTCMPYRVHSYLL